MLTLLVITTLTGLTLAFHEESGVDLDLAAYSRDEYKSYEAARTASQIALALLDEDEDKEMDSLQEPWSQLPQVPLPPSFLDETMVSGRIIDESGKFNVNTLITKEGKIDEGKAAHLSRLLSALGLEDNVIPALMDWIDKDDEERLDGAEDFYYQNLDPPYHSANRSFITLAQIMMVKGIAEIAQFGGEDKKNLLDYLTIYSEGKININTAPKEVLESLHQDLDESIAESIIAFREETDFMSPGDLKQVPEVGDGLYNAIKDLITVKSNAFSIEASGACQEATSLIKAVALREKGKTRLIYWRVF
jgi:general secretion pathway protein K